ncbi:hypothetical protein [Actinoplanes auranticolor]|uniref:Uncharacterized protein n=1 Tax=Actinoplanes auranticolor TaxID=47988 RepID=A0A919SDC4_9ACTN|nr:hypothetical protein [Actinoplanes auranticolor]GIM69766.1 hypothetical protein Aau02nite_37640 [Actinoplanes auranticolor]
MAYPPQPPYDPHQPPQYPQIPVVPPGPPAAFTGYGPQYDSSQPQPPRRSLLPWLALAVTPGRGRHGRVVHLRQGHPDGSRGGGL